jgi:flagellar assembly protein FliH
MLARIVKKDAPDFTVIPFFNFTPVETATTDNNAAHFNFSDTEEFSDDEALIPVAANHHLLVDDVLQAAREEAAQIVAQAESQSAAIEQAARDRAKVDVRAELKEEADAQVAELREELAATIAEISGLKEEISAQAETQLVELALEIAKKVVGREVMFDREIAFTLVKVSLSRLQTHSAARIHLHPEDFAFVNAQRERLNFHGALEIIEDRSISLGGCLIRTDTGDIDARIESQFEEIAHNLLGK